jgi:hypothetical protein
MENSAKETREAAYLSRIITSYAVFRIAYVAGILFTGMCSSYCAYWR